MAASIIKRGLFLLIVSCLNLAPVFAADESAPAFTLKNATGEAVSLSDYAGKPVILHFWASWCPYCKSVQPGLEALAAEYAAQDMVVLGINFREDKGVNPQQVLESRGLHFKTLVHGEEVSRAYGVRGTPTTFFINASGEIVGMTNASKPDDPKLAQLAEKAALTAN
jgi:cytochrome c biogenesis protein CcmG/thiol:disulfide interchange protein DsbE